MAEKLLTDRALKAKKARAKEYLEPDGGSLYARVRRTSSGATSITWQYFFKWDGKTERLSIGPYPAVSLTEARSRRDKARAQLHMDPPQHPVLEERRRAAEAHAKALAEGLQRTVRGLFEDWQTVYLARQRKDGGAGALAAFERHVFPYVGKLPARAMTRAQVSEIVDRIARAGARRQANVVLALLKQMFAHGVVRGLVDVDPTYGFTKKHAGGKEASRERVLSEAELAALAAKLPNSGLSPALQAAVRLLLATGARVGELNLARWSDIDLKAATWSMPKENTKNGRAHLVHLSRFALAALGTLALSRQGDYLLPSRDGKSAIDAKALAKALRDRQRKRPLKNRSRSDLGALALEGGDWSPHDLRRTFATHLADLGVAPYVIERALNHTMQGVMAVYNRHDYLSERELALDAWSAELERIFAGAAAKVVDLVPVLNARRGNARQ